MSDVSKDILEFRKRAAGLLGNCQSSGQDLFLRKRARGNIVMVEFNFYELL